MASGSPQNCTPLPLLSGTVLSVTTVVVSAVTYWSLGLTASTASTTDDTYNGYQFQVPRGNATIADYTGSTKTVLFGVSTPSTVLTGSPQVGDPFIIQALKSRHGQGAFTTHGSTPRAHNHQHQRFTGGFG